MIQIKDDKFWVEFSGDRERRQEALKWCWENWGSAWGEIRDAWPSNNSADFHFVFHRSDHATWFHLKYG